VATPIDKDALTAEERAAIEPRPIECPRCGLVAEGLRCPRCNALKVVGCSGSCKGCIVGCGMRKK